MLSADEYAFLTRENEKAEESDAAIRVKFPSSREIRRETKLERAGAETLAEELFDRFSIARQGASVIVEDVLTLEDFAGSPPVFRMDGEDLDDSLTFLPFEIEIDFERETYTMRAKG